MSHVSFRPEKQNAYKDNGYRLFIKAARQLFLPDDAKILTYEQ
ncbi:hypothetical protein BACEGG_02633 [Bacteroides eggerthii DSM 20697]|nr:hypothetical protein BACEGG_02633 [Bacteroides eggerthii DSM 20697]